MPVGARFAAHGEVESTGLSFEDAAFTHVFGKRAGGSGYRRNATPEWVLKRDQFLAVLVSFFEARARVQPDPRLTLRQRLQKADAMLKATLPRKNAKLDELCAEYVSEKGANADGTWLRTREALIESLDTQIMLTRRGPSFVVAIATYYWSYMMDSMHVAQELRLKPNLVRQTILRLQKAACRIGFAAPRRVAAIVEQYGKRQRKPSLFWSVPPTAAE